MIFCTWRRTVTSAITALPKQWPHWTATTSRTASTNCVKLYEAAYDQLGLDTAEFDNAVIRTLDTVLATPELKEPIAVKRKSVVYVYVDPALESLPPLQKQLLRMGPENILLIKQFARAMRNRLLEPHGY